MCKGGFYDGKSVKIHAITIAMFLFFYLFSIQEAEELWAYFDRDGAGGINIDEFILAFRVIK